MQAALAVAADLFALGERADAALALEQVLASQTLSALHDARQHEQIASLLLIAGKDDEACRHYAAAAGHYRNDGAPLGELRCRLQLGELAQDKEANTRAAQLAAELGHARLDRQQHRQLAALFEASGELALAVTHLEAALATPAVAVPVPSRRINAVAMRLQLLASELELSQLRKQPQQETEQDALSGNLTRAALNTRLPALIAAAHDGQSLSLLQITIDRFSEIRAQRARHIGDDVVRTVTALLRIDRRPAELLARIGDDEFLLALPGRDAEAAQQEAEILRQRIAGYDWASLHPALALSVSIGCASCLPGDSTDVLLFRADLARYLAQRGGGNHVSCAAEVSQ
ncbi:hypothetical protein JHS3_23600 [Jeongeupia sp. HS-3]|nr:hypothetical protein JHS3_23600 [Jeongeupia sp. HS-3]